MVVASSKRPQTHHFQELARDGGVSVIALREVVGHLRSALALDHFLEINGDAIHDSFDELLTLLCGGKRRLFVRLIGPDVRADIFGKSGEAKGGLELLRVAGKVFWDLMTALEEFFCV